VAKHQVIIPRDGISDGSQKVRAIYSPMIAQTLGALGMIDMRRASHVEPGVELSEDALEWLVNNGGATEQKSHHADKRCWRMWTCNGAARLVDKWWADLLPVDGPVLGPFETNTEALEAEVVWLKAHNVPICGPCRDAAEDAILEKTNEHDVARHTGDDQHGSDRQECAAVVTDTEEVAGEGAAPSSG